MEMPVIWMVRDSDKQSKFQLVNLEKNEWQCKTCAFNEEEFDGKNCPTDSIDLICDKEENRDKNWIKIETVEAYYPELKESQGVKHDLGKTQYRLVPPFALEEIAKNLTFGEAKYEAFNWQRVPNAQDRYIDAAMRHIEAFRRGEKLDPENNLSHLAAAAVNLMFLLEFDLNPNLKDKQQ